MSKPDDVRATKPILAIEAVNQRSFVPAAVLEQEDGFPVGDGPNVGSSARSFSPWAILRFKWTAILTAIAALALAEAVIWSVLAPEYQATATIEVQPLIRGLLEGDEPIPFYQTYLETQPSVVSDERLLLRVLEQPEVKQTAWYRGTPASSLDRFRNPGRPIDRLREALEISVPRGKQVLTITMKASRPGEAKVIVDVLANQYLLHASDLSRQEKNADEKRLLVMEGELQLKFEGLEADLAALQNDPDVQTPNPDELAQARKDALENLETRRDEYARNLDVYRKALAEADSQTPTSQPVNTWPLELDPEWRRLSHEINELDLKIETGYFGAQHPTMREWRKTRELRIAERTQREAMLKQQPIPSAAAMTLQPGLAYPRLEWELPRDPETLKASISQLEARLASIDAELRIKQDTHKSTLEKHRRYHALQAELDRVRQKLLRVREQKSEIDIGRNAPAHIHQLGPAVEPPGPANDRRFKLAIAAVFGAFAAGVGAAFLRHRFTPQVLTVEEVTGPHAQTLLGFVPLDSGQAAPEDALTQMREECIRSIRTLMLPRLSSERGQVVQVTSATPGAGKTTFAIMLAKSLASCGKRVLLVDTDLRKPSLSARYAKEKAAGLMELLAGKGIRNQGIRKTPEAGVSVLPAGKRPDSSGIEVLADGLFAGLLAEWREQYDVIVLDGGPVFPVADGAILAQHADGTILVVREGHCHTSMVREAAARLTGVGGRVLGIVFVGRMTGRSYGYPYYGSYSQPATEAPTAPNETDTSQGAPD